MADFIETKFGKIPMNELTFSNFLEFPQISLPTYFDKKLTDKLVVEESKQSRLFKVNGRITRLPKFLTPSLAYFVGYFFGDGGMKDLEKSVKVTGREDHKFKIADEHLMQIEQIQKIYAGLFWLDIAVRKERLEKGEKTYYLETTNLVVYRFLCNVFGLSGGKKDFSLKIPGLIKNSHLEIKKAFLRGLFDADGDTRAVEAGFNSQSRVKLRMKQKQLMFEVKDMLKEVFGVSVNGPYYDSIGSSYIQIERQSCIVNLAENNLFFHPIKKWRLDKTANFLKNKNPLKG